MESRESCLAADGRAYKVDGRAQALVGPGLATPLHTEHHHEKQDSILDIYNSVEFTMTFVLTHLIPILIHPKFYLPKF